MSPASRQGAVTGPSPKPDRVERTTARYLFAISALSMESHERISTGELREYMDVTPASVSEMISKLNEQGVVDYEKYHGVKLTDQGRRIAANVGWRFCVVTSFFESVLDTPLEERTAFDIGCTLPENGISRLRDRLDAPCLDLCPKSGHERECCPV
ncbi:MAG: metal-dependent transcriptional regulator [Halorientalis sp.]